jgi:tRNA pseudouridine55 synthase
MDGILIINKPTGPTSHDIVDRIRKITRIRKIGHAGTLDPFAQGVLIVLIKNATKLQTKFMNMAKTYVATLKLGETSDTYDIGGQKSKCQNLNIKSISNDQISNVIKKFIGEIEQIPPIHSAVKVNGERAYKLAWQGIKPDLKPRKIKIYNIKILNYKWPYLEIEVDCSRGTYIRSLANDIGQKLGCGAYLEKLTRIKIGKFNIENSIKIEDLNSQNWTKKLISANL